MHYTHCACVRRQQKANF